MNSERELFLYELDGRGYHFRNTNWIDKSERFDDWQLNMAWEMWCASAQRQGYKLVPVETLECALEWFGVVENEWTGAGDMSECFKHKDIIEKAMIGAVDEK